MDGDFNKFMDAFKDIFMKPNKDVSKIEKKQLIIGTGKDSHPDDKETNEKKEQVLIGHGKDSKSSNEVDNRHARLSQLYDELRAKTAVHVEKKDAQERKNGRLEVVKKDLVDLLNGLQSRETFAYHDGKFALKQEKDEASTSLETASGSGSASGSVVKKKETEDSKLAVVESLLEQLKSLEEAKKREQNDLAAKKEILKEKEQKKSEESTDNATAERIKKIFKDAFAREIEKRKTVEAKQMEKKEDNYVHTKKSSLRDTLVQLMSQLDKRIADEKSTIEDDEKQISQLETNTVAMKKDSTTSSDKKKSFEEELDSILSDFSARDNEKNQNLDKALKGFNVKPKESDRP